ncbi:stage III sporulation protein AE [Ihubacter sp. rT4E-8]|uniref:stage III sporulation protein AE n=1 Tax=unclassified Ihubacter TaxID=2633299 RepID=UPI001379D048
MDFDKIVKEQMKNILDQEQINSLQDYADNLSDGISEHFTLEQILDSTLSGKSIFQSQEIIDSLKTLFFYEIKSALVIGIEILTVCIIIGLLKNMSGSFGKKGTAEVATLICCIVIVGLAMTNFREVYQMTMDAVKTITYTMEILLPILIAILISMGQIASGTIMSPLLLTAVTIFQFIIKNVILPAIFLSTVFTLLNCLTEKDYVNQLAKFLRQAALFITGIVLTLMTGIIAIQGLIAKTSDSLIIGTAKYSLDAFIPIVGGFAADTAELFLKCMGSIKSVVGVFGILLILCLILTPIIKILVIALVYKVTALLIEPVASKKIAAGVADVGTCLIMMGSVLFFASLLFIIFITSIINLGGNV